MCPDPGGDLEFQQWLEEQVAQLFPVPSMFWPVPSMCVWIVHCLRILGHDAGSHLLLETIHSYRNTVLGAES